MARRYDVFVSYARKDNDARALVPGLVTAATEFLLGNDEPASRPALQVFFDKDGIAGGDDWRARILAGLSSSKILVVFVSRSYFDSSPCRWEWDAFLEGVDEIQAELGLSSIVPVLLDDADPAMLPPEGQRWHDTLLAANALADLRPWLHAGQHDLDRGVFAEAMVDLRRTLQQWLAEDRTPRGNIPQATVPFVGRTDLLNDFDRALHSPASVGRVLAVHGPTGIGKTELLTNYARRHPRDFAGGVWMLRAGGKKDLVATMAALADFPDFEFQGTERMRTDPRQLGAAVLQALAQRADAEPDVVVWLDNVTEPDLLTSDQTKELPWNPHLHFVVTTELDPAEVPQWRSLESFEVPPLSGSDAVVLARRVLRSRDPAADVDGRGADMLADLAEVTGGNPRLLQRGARILAAESEDGLQALLGTLSAEGADKQVALAIYDNAIDRLDRTCATALRLAAAIPGDVKPWPWVERLLVLSGAHGDGEAARRTLTEERLLDPAEVPELSILQPLVSQAASGAASPEDRRAAGAALQDLLAARAQDAMGTVGLQPWEHRVFADVATRVIRQDPAFARRVNLEGLPGRLSQHLGDETPTDLATAVIDALEGTGSEPAEMVTALNNASGQIRRQDRLRALAMVERSAQLSRSLVAQDPNEVNRDLLADALGRLAEFLRSSDDPVDKKRAARLAQEALDIRRELNERTHGYEDRRQLIAACELMARILVRSDKPAAIELHREALRVSQEFVADHPSDLAVTRSLARAHANLSRELKFFDVAESLEHAELSLKITEQIVDAEPSNLSARSWLATALMQTSAVQRQSDPDGALEAARRAVRIAEEVAAAQPGNLEAARGLAIVIGNLVRTLGRGAAEESLGLIRRSLDIAAELAALQPDNVDAMRGLAIAKTDLSNALLATSVLYAQQARDAARDAAELDAERNRVSPDNGTMSGYATSLEAWSRALELHEFADLPDLAGALERAEQAEALVGVLVERSPKDNYLRSMGKRLEQRIARLHASLAAGPPETRARGGWSRVWAAMTAAVRHGAR